MNSTLKSILFKAGTILVLIGICVAMIFVGRGHTVYVETQPITYEGKTIEAPYKVVVNVKGEEIARLMEKERGKTTCLGQSITLDLEVMDVKGGEKYKKSFDVQLPMEWDGIIINLTGLLADLPQDACLTKYIAVEEQKAAEEAETDEEINTDEFALGDF